MRSACDAECSTDSSAPLYQTAMGLTRNVRAARIPTSLILHQTAQTNGIPGLFEGNLAAACGRFMPLRATVANIEANNK
jgi:hypothetical protein